MVIWREKGCCYNCDEHYGPNHKCKAKFFLLIASDDESQNDPVPPNLTSIISNDPPPIATMVDNSPSA